MRLPGRGKKKQLPVDVRRMVLAALASALEDSRNQQPAKDVRKGLTGVRAVAAGAALVTAGRAAYKNRDFIRDRLKGDEDQPVEDEEYEDAEYEDEPEAEAEEDFEEEPEAEEDEEPEAEEEEEPEAEEDEEPEAEEDEEPEAEEDEELEAEAEEEEEPEAEDDEEPEAEADEDVEEEPEDEGDEGPVDEGDEGPEGEGDEDFEEGPEAEEDEQPGAEADDDADDDSEADEGPHSDARPSNIDEGRPPIFDRPLGRRKRSRPSTRPPKHADGEPVLKPPPRPSRSRAPVGRT
jgi:hypothetical protein